MWISESAFLILTLFFKGMVLNFDINVFIIARENSCKIGRAPYGVRLIPYNAVRAPYDIVRCPSGHRPMLSYTDAGRRPYDMWPRKRKIFIIVRCPGDYQIRRWCANCWNRTMSVLIVTIALMWKQARYVLTVAVHVHSQLCQTLLVSGFIAKLLNVVH